MNKIKSANACRVFGGAYQYFGEYITGEDKTMYFMTHTGWDHVLLTDEAPGKNGFGENWADVQFSGNVTGVEAVDILLSAMTWISEYMPEGHYDPLEVRYELDDVRKKRKRCYVVTGIDWDTDGEDVSLPKEVVLPDTVSREDAIGYISDMYEFCINGTDPIEPYTPTYWVTVDPGDPDSYPEPYSIVTARTEQRTYDRRIKAVRRAFYDPERGMWLSKDGDTFESVTEWRYENDDVIFANARFVKNGCKDYFGRLADGTYFFIRTYRGRKDCSAITAGEDSEKNHDSENRGRFAVITNEDPGKNLDSEEWRNKHTLCAIEDELMHGLLIRAVEWIKQNRPAGDYDIDELSDILESLVERRANSVPFFSLMGPFIADEKECGPITLKFVTYETGGEQFLVKTDSSADAILRAMAVNILEEFLGPADEEEIREIKDLSNYTVCDVDMEVLSRILRRDDFIGAKDDVMVFNGC